MATNEIRVVLTDDQGNSIVSGQDQEKRQQSGSSLATGAAAGVGGALGSSYRQKKINALTEWEDKQIAAGGTGISIGRSPDRVSRAFNRSKGLLMATDKDLSSYERTMGAKQFMRNISAPTIRQAAGIATVGLQVANIGFDIAEHNASIAGNTHKAGSLANTQSIINDMSGILLAAAINPAAGALMLGMTVYRKVMEHDKYIRELKISSTQSAYYAQRISTAISTSGRVSV